MGNIKSNRSGKGLRDPPRTVGWFFRPRRSQALQWVDDVPRAKPGRRHGPTEKAAGSVPRAPGGTVPSSQDREPRTNRFAQGTP